MQSYFCKPVKGLKKPTNKHRAFMLTLIVVTSFLMIGSTAVRADDSPITVHQDIPTDFKELLNGPDFKYEDGKYILNNDIEISSDINVWGIDLDLAGHWNS